MFPFAFSFGPGMSGLWVIVRFLDGTQIERVIQFGPHSPGTLTFVERNVSEYRWIGAHYLVTSSFLYGVTHFHCRLRTQQEVCIAPDAHIQ